MTEFTNPWLQFLAQQGIEVDEAGIARPVDGDSTVQNLAENTGFVAPLTDLGLIAVTGDDAATFLHNQLTNDVEHLRAGEARLAGYCSPKGRLLATFLMWREGEIILLQLPGEIQAAVQKRLQMFLLRAKAKLSDACAGRVALGLVGTAVGEALSPWFPSLPTSPYSVVSAEAGSLIRLPDADGAPRYQWVTSPDIAQHVWPKLRQTLAAAGTSRWRLSQIHAGIPQVTKATQEQFVPQMINFEVIGGVNFRKGCYPGQEIVARSQYLGKLKRRMALASVAAPDVPAGMEVFSSADPGQPCGMIVNAERAGQGTDCLVELKSAAREEGSVHLGSADGPRLQFRDLPYVLSDPI